MTELSKCEKEIYDLRREKVKKLIDKGIESFPTHFKNASFINDVHANHQNLSNGEQTNIILTKIMTNIYISQHSAYQEKSPGLIGSYTINIS